MKPILIATMLSSMLPLVLSYCCGGDGSGICGDGTTQGAGCCGYQSCNIFCCNCDPQPGECRGGRNNKRSGGSTSRVPNVFVDKRADSGTEAIFKEIDKEGHGAFSLDEYLEYMDVVKDGGERRGYWISWFEQHDKNSDGLIDLEEAM